MRARDLMQCNLVTTLVHLSVGELCDRLQAAHVHSAPVVGNEGELLGIVSIEDILFGGAFSAPGAPPPTVGEIMTSPVFSGTEDMSLKEICETMWNYRVHHLPIERNNKLVGVISSLDICRVVTEIGLSENEEDEIG